MVCLTDQPIDPQAALTAVRSKAAGAVVLFLGTTRQFTQGEETIDLTYDGYREMAEVVLRELARQAEQRWELTASHIVHRLGQVPLGEISVAVAVSAPHRRAAFEAGQWLIDRLKESVPLWKQEHWADGRREWIHPPNAWPEMREPPCHDS